MTGKELLDTIYIKLESYATNLNDTYNDLVQNDLDEELEWSANEIMNEKIVVYDLMYKIPKLEEKLELLTKYKRAFDILKDKFKIQLRDDVIESVDMNDNPKTYYIYEVMFVYDRAIYSHDLEKEQYELLEELMKSA